MGVMHREGVEVQDAPYPFGGHFEPVFLCGYTLQRLLR